MNPDHNQSIGIFLFELFQFRQDVNAIDAAVGPEIQQDDFTFEVSFADRFASGIQPINSLGEVCNVKAILEGLNLVHHLRLVGSLNLTRISPLGLFFRRDTVSGSVVYRAGLASFLAFCVPTAGLLFSEQKTFLSSGKRIAERNKLDGTNGRWSLSHALSSWSQSQVWRIFSVLLKTAVHEFHPSPYLVKIAGIFFFLF